MDKLDVQVQLKVIELAEKWTHETISSVERTGYMQRLSAEFDKAYKSIMKTITDQNLNAN
jgi:hypothetical protein